MARRLGTSIFEIAQLVDCSRSTVVSTYAKWMNDGETSSRRHGVGRLHAIKEKAHRRLPRMVNRLYTGRWRRYYAVGYVLLGVSGTCGCGRADHECYRVSEHHCGPVHLYMASVFPAGNGMFQQDSVPCHKANIVFEWFQEHDAEFQLKSWSPNSPDLNKI
ncbi:DDE_3 domain-containing protein [Trichonephila clavipes]|uniref:DDE_3 domain-containing protein n=1 Tax=Trichonephila clavipes TaxID=2585209 RepID=A0A8X6VBV1_TRICX|nr:DDE_3 domain-containing protein [Trichonephila clavipes]